ncbi:unnamed protein product [Angiostrongylus costaricensis]|uniref:Aa_trans domain-containing protein n=1 Tax=Angiostrongylus costaricensis TaxID=334426 RepID=A0A0R3PFS2_ANGCS|nr:unnamed protein product [Angiostrongylus costaricensis]
MDDYYMREKRREIVLSPAVPVKIGYPSSQISGVFIARQWTENRPADAPLPFRRVISKALGMIRSNPVAFVVSATTCCAEIASQMFVFVWAPLFMRIEHNGGKSIRELPFLHNDWRATRFERVFLCMVVFEIACGVYSPAMEALQATVLQLPPQRSAVVALIRLPLTFFLSLSILMFFPTIGGEFKLMTIIVILLFIATLLSLLLDIMVMNRGYEQDPDRFILPKTILTDVKQTEQTTCTS